MKKKITKTIACVLLLQVVTITGIITCIMLYMTITGLTECGDMKSLDTTPTFKTAIIEMPGGEVKTIDIENWTDFAGNQLQIEATNGQTYYVHANKCIMLTK